MKLDRLDLALVFSLLPVCGAPADSDLLLEEDAEEGEGAGDILGDRSLAAVPLGEKSGPVMLRLADFLLAMRAGERGGVDLVASTLSG